MKTLFMIVWVLFSLEVFAQDTTFKESPYRDVIAKIGNGKPVFLEVGSDSCRSCRVMGGMLYATAQRHPGYAIYFINVKKERAAAGELGVRMIPTQIIFDKEGREVFRHIGMLEAEELAGLFRTHGF